MSRSRRTDDAPYIEISISPLYWINLAWRTLREWRIRRQLDRAWKGNS